MTSVMNTRMAAGGAIVGGVASIGLLKRSSEFEHLRIGMDGYSHMLTSKPAIVGATVLGGAMIGSVAANLLKGSGSALVQHPAMAGASALAMGGTALLMARVGGIRLGSMQAAALGSAVLIDAVFLTMLGGHFADHR